MPKSPQRSTIADVARYAGVSKATVSRFLNHRDTLLTPAIAKRVETAVAALGYIPSPMAQALKRGRTRLVGLVVADITNPYSVAVLSGAELACREAGYLVMLFNLGNESDRESAGIQALSSYKVEGFILNTMGHDAGAMLEAAGQGRPVVLVDRLHPGFNADFVSLNNSQAIRLCMDHLMQSGYRDFLLVSEPFGQVTSRVQRADAYSAFIAAGAPDLHGGTFECGHGSEGDLVKRLIALRDTSRGTPAVISNNAVVTLRLVAAVAALGWKLGTDIGLIGIDDAPWAPYVGPGITTVAQPTDEIGRLAARCLLQRMEGLSAEPRNLALPGSLRVRGSTKMGPSVATA